MNMVKKLAPWLGVPACLVAVVTLWNVFNLPRLAWASELEKLNRRQALDAVELYNNKVRSLLAVPAPTAEPNKSVWQEEVDKAKRQRRDAEERWLKLK